MEPAGSGVWLRSSFLVPCKSWMSIMRANMSGKSPARPSPPSHLKKRDGSPTSSRGFPLVGLRRSLPLLNVFLPWHLRLGNRAAFLKPKPSIFAPTPSACVILSFVLKACMWAVGLQRPLVKSSFPLVPNGRACAGLPRAWMPSLPCALPLSTRTSTSVGSLPGRLLDCLQFFPTPGVAEHVLAHCVKILLLRIFSASGKDLSDSSSRVGFSERLKCLHFSRRAVYNTNSYAETF